MQGVSIDPQVLASVFFLFGGRDDLLSVNTMESRILEWGMKSCADDPVIDFPTFNDGCLSYMRLTGLVSKEEEKRV
jgi:hypothetical protein